MPQSSPLFKNIKFTENFSAVQDMYELNALIDKLYNEDKLLGFDIETGYSGKDAPGRAPNTYHKDQFIVGFSITNATNWARYVPIRHDFADNLDPNVVWSLMKPLLEEKQGVVQNISFEGENLRNLDRKGDGPDIVIPVSEWYDSMIEAYILADIPPMLVDGSLEEGELVNRYIPPFHRTEDGFQKPEIKQFLVGLKSLTKFRYNYDQKDIHSLFNSGKELTAQQKKMIRFNTLPVSPEVVHYACDDAYLCLQLHNDQYARILEDEFLPNLYRLEMQIAEMLVEMRETGINVDWDRLRTNKDIKDKFLHEMEVDTKKKFAQEAGRDIPELNLNSPVQLQKLIFGKKADGGMGIRGTQTTASGALSTNDKALSAVKKESPAVDGLLKYRQAKKTAEWVDLWSGLYDEAWDHKIHPSFIQVRVPSGRFASAGPNVQTLTKTWWYQKGTDPMADTIRSGTLGEDFWTDNARDMVVASPGYKLLSFDYASAEIQFLGALAKETEIIEAFHRGEDFHKWAASIMYSKDIKDVTKKERQAAKSFSFGSVYQQGLKALSETLNITLAEAEDIQTKYFSAFPNVNVFFEQQKYRAATDYEVRTWMGRKITLWEGMHESPRVRSKAARLSINTVVQGGATGDYVKLAMVNVRKRLIERGWWGKEVRLLMNQHDSLVFEHSEDIDQKELIEYLTPAISFDLTGVTGMYDTFEVFPPMSIDWETGYRWGSMVPVYAKDYSDAKELLVTLDPNITKEALKAVMDVLILNPGDCPVTVYLGDNHIQPRPINPSEALLDYLKNGDPDRGVSVKPGEFASAEYVMV